MGVTCSSLSNQNKVKIYPNGSRISHPNKPHHNSLAHQNNDDNNICNSNNQFIQTNDIDISTFHNNYINEDHNTHHQNDLSIKNNPHRNNNILTASSNNPLPLLQTNTSNNLAKPSIVLTDNNKGYDKAKSNIINVKPNSFDTQYIPKVYNSAINNKIDPLIHNKDSFILKDKVSKASNFTFQDNDMIQPSIYDQETEDEDKLKNKKINNNIIGDSKSLQVINKALENLKLLNMNTSSPTVISRDNKKSCNDQMDYTKFDTSLQEPADQENEIIENEARLSREDLFIYRFQPNRSSSRQSNLLVSPLLLQRKKIFFKDRLVN